MKFDLCSDGPIPALRGQDRLERLPEPERHRVGTPVAKTFPLRFERPLDPDVAVLDRQEQIRVDQPELPQRRGVHPFENAGDRRLSPGGENVQSAPGNLGYPDVQTRIPS